MVNFCKMAIFSIEIRILFMNFLPCLANDNHPSLDEEEPDEQHHGRGSRHGWTHRPIVPQRDAARNLDRYQVLC